MIMQKQGENRKMNICQKIEKETELKDTYNTKRDVFMHISVMGVSPELKQYAQTDYVSASKKLNDFYWNQMGTDDGIYNQN